MVDRSPTAARQLASRARRRVQGAAPAPDPDLREQRRVVDAFFAAARDGDFEGLVAVLHPDVVLRADEGPRLARRPGRRERGPPRGPVRSPRPPSPGRLSTASPASSSSAEGPPVLGHGASPSPRAERRHRRRLSRLSRPCARAGRGRSGRRGRDPLTSRRRSSTDAGDPGAGAFASKRTSATRPAAARDESSPARRGRLAASARRCGPWTVRLRARRAGPRGGARPLPGRPLRVPPFGLARRAPDRRRVRRRPAVGEVRAARDPARRRGPPALLGRRGAHAAAPRPARRGPPPRRAARRRTSTTPSCWRPRARGRLVDEDRWREAIGDAVVARSREQVARAVERSLGETVQRSSTATAARRAARPAGERHAVDGVVGSRRRRPSSCGRRRS